MTQLIKCIECGGTVSEVAQQCPHCGTKFIKGEICDACKKPFKHSELEYFQNSKIKHLQLMTDSYKHPDNSPIYLCEKCTKYNETFLDLLKSELSQHREVIKCEACHQIVKVYSEDKPDSQDVDSCPHCGHPNHQRPKKHGHCYFCQGVILKEFKSGTITGEFFEKEISGYYQSSSGEWKTTYKTVEYNQIRKIFHKACFEKVPYLKNKFYEESQKIAEKEAAAKEAARQREVEAQKEREELIKKVEAKYLERKQKSSLFSYLFKVNSLTIIGFGVRFISSSLLLSLWIKFKFLQSFLQSLSNFIHPLIVLILIIMINYTIVSILIDIIFKHNIYNYYFKHLKTLEKEKIYVLNNIDNSQLTKEYLNLSKNDYLSKKYKI
jgi:predicted amidophosphoribosyltransferase